MLNNRSTTALLRHDFRSTIHIPHSTARNTDETLSRQPYNRFITIL